MQRGKRLSPVGATTKHLIEQIDDAVLHLKDDLETLEGILEQLRRLHHVE